MQFFYDCEFIEDGQTIDLISIGMVTPAGREYYAVSSGFSVSKLHKNQWLVDHVWPHLPTRGPILDWSNPAVRSRRQIAGELYSFLMNTDPDWDAPVLWSWYADYDHVALAQLWGPMTGLPDGIPKYTKDLQQEVERLGNPPLPDPPIDEHNALADARYHLAIGRAIGVVL